MQILTRRSGSLSKKVTKDIRSFGELARDMHPDIKWVLQMPTREVTEVYGSGVVVRGEKGAFIKEYFILFEDPRREEWINMIAAQLQGEIKEYGE